MTTAQSLSGMGLIADTGDKHDYQKDFTIQPQSKAKSEMRDLRYRNTILAKSDRKN